MAGLIATSDLDNRGIEYADADQAGAIIADASALARSYVAPIFDDLETPDAPDSVVAVVCSMARRALGNPRGLNMEALGDYTYQATGGVATLYPTARERRILRQAAVVYATANSLTIPAWGTGGIYQQVDLPSAPYDDLGLV